MVCYGVHVELVRRPFTLKVGARVPIHGARVLIGAAGSRLVSASDL